jgi:hypothetical protein
MIIVRDDEWAINSRQEILLAADFSGVETAPKQFVHVEEVGLVIFQTDEVARLQIPKEILDIIVAKKNILIVSLRGGTITHEARVPISRK